MYNAGPAQPLTLRGSNGVTSKAPRHRPVLSALSPAPHQHTTSLAGGLQGTSWGLTLLPLFTSLSPALFFSYLKILNF